MPEEIHFKIKRQAGPDARPDWEEFKMPYAPGHNVVSALMYLREHPINVKGKKVDPVVWDSNCMEEVCGACSMIINGVPRQACAALIDNLKQPIVLEPLTKFPLVRDLMVDRQKMFDALLKIKAWVPVDGTWDIHRHAPLISPGEQSIRYLFSRCMTCGCCMEVCPQFHQDSTFMGPAPIGQARLHNSHPTGGYFKEDRLHTLMEKGGIADCGNAQNCAKVCPKDIPLTEAIGDIGRQTTIQWLRDLFVK
ncbi:MAG TPA: succinate dehydrogenase iron-sulfur subunit [Phycisphaerae bacterium]|nr:succinate dehydrogenase iron-sulfur subunit [Phycisphaerae bacterium]